MKIEAMINFTVFNCEDSPPENVKVNIFCTLAQRGLKYIWEEIPDGNYRNDLKDTIAVYLDSDFRITNKNYWFDDGVGLIKIPFHEEHIAQLKEIEK